MQVDGACHCGGIRFTARVDPQSVRICHCTDCQTLSGTAFRVVAPAEPGSFRLEGGEPRAYVKTAESGARRATMFCPTCGTQLFSCNAGDDPGRISIRIGALRQRGELAPQSQIWRRSAQGWVDGIASLPASQQQG